MCYHEKSGVVWVVGWVIDLTFPQEGLQSKAQSQCHPKALKPELTSLASVSLIINTNKNIHSEVSSKMFHIVSKLVTFFLFNKLSDLRKESALRENVSF